MHPTRSLRSALRSMLRRRDGASQKESRSKELGQVLPMFAIMAIVVLGGAALLTDVAWWWTNEQRMQRAADAASLAGAVYLPGDEVKAFASAQDAALKNGYTNGAGGVVVTPRRDPDNPRKLIVDIDGPVQTNFARVFCWNGGPCLNSVAVGVTGAAEFVLPVPMGSPENYYGVFGATRGLTSSAMVSTNHTDPGWSCGSGDSWTTSGCTARVPTQTAVPNNWAVSPTGSGRTVANSLQSNNDVFGRVSGGDLEQGWTGFSAQTGIPNPGTGESVDIAAIQLRVSDAYIDSACAGTGSPSAYLEIHLSWDNGASWTSDVRVPPTGSLGTSTTSGDWVVGGPVNEAGSPWGAHNWTRADLANLQMHVMPRETCTGAKTFSVDMVDVRIKWNYSYTTTALQTTNLTDQLLKGPGTACVTGKADCFEADGATLNARGFWATLNTQGAENINGDAYQTGYDTRTSGVSPACPANSRACYDATNYYNYAIEMPPGATNGKVYVYDPVFCDVNEQRGTGDRWFSGSTAVSTFYTLYDTGSSLYDLSEDTELAASGANFRSMDFADSTMSGSGGDECLYRTDSTYGDGRDYHNRWFLLNPDSSDSMVGGTEGKVYRIHTTSTDPTNTAQQLGTNGENSFAIYVSATVPGGGSPRIYGLGAMQAYTPLTANSAIDTSPDDDVISEFYLAQIEAAHAGKTIEVRLWDPGDTQALRAELQILEPTDSGWSPVSYSYTAAQGTTNSGRAACNSLTSTGTTSVVTNNGGGSGGGIFNGCWLTMRAKVPDTYDGDQDGWWKIRYRMDGTGTSFDVTTWQVNLIGNPVHLVPE